MNKKLVMTLVSLSLVGLIWVSLRILSPTVITTRAPTVTNIKLAKPQYHDFSKTCRWFGKVNSSNHTTIIARTAGQINTINKADNSAVAVGDLLFTLGGTLIENKKNKIKQQLQLVTQQLTMAQQRIKIKQQMLAQKVITRDEMLIALDIPLQLKKEQVRLHQTLKQLTDSSQIRSTVSGIFTNRSVSVGQQIQINQLLADIIGTTQLYINATLFSQQCGHSLFGKTVTINLPSTPPINARVISVYPQMTAEGAIQLRISGNKLNSFLYPNQLVSGTILLDQHQQALAIPIQALVRDSHEQTFILLKKSQGYYRQQVDVGLHDHGWLEIINGLAPSDKVVVNGAYELFHQKFNQSYKVAD